MGYRYNAITGELDFFDSSSEAGNDITQINADAGSALPVAGIVNLSGSNSVTTSATGNTVTVKNLADITKYVVDPIAGETAYQTIQSAINAANTAGGPATVYIRPATYTENLTHYDGIDLWGAVGVADTQTCKIIGTHIPPASGTLTIRNIFLQSATDIFTSAVAGTADLILIDDAVAVTNGYTFNLPNWTGSFTGFDIGEIGSTNDGWINNTGGAFVFMVNITAGKGSGNTCTISGSSEFYNVHVQCPITFQSTGTAVLSGGCWFDNTITTADTATVGMYNSLADTGVNQAITHNSGNALTLSTVTINSSNSPAVGGTGTIDSTGVDFVDDATYAGTLTINGGKSISGSARLIDRTANTVAYYSTGGELGEIGPLTDGQIIIGSTGSAPVSAALTSTSGSVTITNGAGSINLETTKATNDETKVGTDTNKNLSPANLISYNNDKKFTGFLEWGGAGAYYSVVGTQLTVLRSGSGYIKGQKISWTAPQTTASLTKGNTYLVYIDSTGTIGATSSFTQANYEDNIPLFEILCDNDTPSNTLVVKENHPYSAPTDLSVYLHNSIGTVISNRNNGANITLNGTDEIEISGTDYLEDHGLETTIPDSGGVGETWEFYYVDGSGKWVFNTSTATFPSVYNNAGVVTALGVNKYGVFRLYCSKEDLNSSTPKYIAVIDDAQYNNQSAADAAISNGNISYATNELFNLEVCQLGYVIYEESSSSIVEVIIEKATIRGSFVAINNSSANLITTDTSNFNGWLTATDTTVQTALETLDDVGLGVTPEHAVLLGGASYAIDATAVGTTGQLLVGATGADPAFGSSAAADFTFTTATAGTTRTLNVTNTDNTAANVSGASLNISVGGATQTGDPFVHFGISGGAETSFGIDTSSTDLVKITTGASPSAGTALMVFDPTPADVSVNPSTSFGGQFAYLGASYTGTVVQYGAVNLDNTNAASDARYYAYTGGASGGDPSLDLIIAGVREYIIKADNADSDKFKIISGVPAGASSTILDITSAGAMTINSAYTLPTADGNANDVLTTDGAAAVSWSPRSAVQHVYSRTTAVVTCATAVAMDNTKPQQTEGDEVLTVTITPKSASNILSICFASWGSNTTNSSGVVAFYQDATADSIAASNLGTLTAGYQVPVTLTHEMVAGTTSSTTFKARVGSIGGTFYVNSNNGGGNFFNGVSSTTLVITEYTP